MQFYKFLKTHKKEDNGNGGPNIKFGDCTFVSFICVAEICMEKD